MNRTEPRHAAIAAQADILLAESATDDYALITPSVYETARLVSISPWLGGHAARLDYLLAEQAPDGGWGVTGFRIVPTLSVTEALLTVLERRCSADLEVARDRLGHAAIRGLDALRGWLTTSSAGAIGLPDTVAIELIVPRLVAQINSHLDRHARSPVTGLPRELSTAPFLAPADTRADLVELLRQETWAGRPVPDKLWHTWETLSSDRRQPAEVPLVAGAVACSPAATAAWLGGPPEPGHPAACFLDEVQRRGGGPVPVATPMPYFERAWMLSVLGARGVPHTAPATVLDGLDAALGEYGIGAGPGLPPDADDTASVLYALALNGRGRRPESLMHYFGGDHFFCYPEERTPSPTTNAHALEAVACWVSGHAGEQQRYGPAIQMTIDWLMAVQNQDGSWTDKWHGSAYYATACCASALAAYGAPRAAAAVERAISWILDTQHSSGKWGHGQGTVEETAYAVFILQLACTPRLTAPSAAALDAAARILASEPVSPRDPTLWIGKDVYTPLRIAQVTRLAALYAINAGR